MFGVITLTELAAGILCAVGFLSLLFFEQAGLALYGLELSALNLVMLFAGQRLAKDYAGAASLVPYFLTAVLGLGLFLDL